MISIAKLYALTSVTLRGTVMLIPAVDFKSNKYPFDLHVVLPNFILMKNTIDPFLRFLHFVDFHHAGKMSISSLIQIDTNSLLDVLYKNYLSYWKANDQIAEIPARRRIVEEEIIKWSKQLPKTSLREFIHKYYSISVEKTDWRRKTRLWKSLRHKEIKKKKPSKKKLTKLKEKYVDIWFKYVDKIDFSSKIQSKFPKFAQLMNKLTFKEILEEVQLNICPACEIDLSDYPPDIKYCFDCGYPLTDDQQKYCASCGSELREGAQFCSDCGKKIK